MTNSNYHPPVPSQSRKHEWINSSPLVLRWLPENVSERRGTDWIAVMDKAAAWGADERLSECIEKLDVNGCPDRWLDILRAMLPAND